jgi:acetyl-CoA carboxylase beta subunit
MPSSSFIGFLGKKVINDILDVRRKEILKKKEVYRLTGSLAYMCKRDTKKPDRLSKIWSKLRRRVSARCSRFETDW